MRLRRAKILFKDRLTLAIRGVLKPGIYIYSGDCGTGKSKLVQDELRRWKATGFANDNGAIIFVANFAEVDAYKDGAGLDRDDYAVLTSDTRYKTYGAGFAAAGKVPVLFASHEKAWRLLAGLGSFADAAALHYRGKPRTFRVWEESFLPVQYASFSYYSLSGLPSALKGYSKTDASMLNHLAEAANRIRVGEEFDIPLAVGDVANRLTANKAIAGDARRTLDALAKIAGSKAIKLDDGDDCQFNGVGRSMPADIGPLFVLDASARLTNRYDDWSPHGMNIVRLEPATVSYTALSVHWWNKGSGKSILRNEKERATIYGAIAELINSKPGERFLLIISKQFVLLNEQDKAVLPVELSANVHNVGNVAVTTWGRHRSSNDHREYENVILVGAWDYDNATYSAIDAATSGLSPSDRSDDNRRATRLSEFGHNAYQAICRCNVRNNVGAICGKANAYLIMTDGGGRRAKVGEAFPGAAIETWQPEPPKKEDKIAKVLAILSTIMADRMFASFADVRAAAGTDDRTYLTKIIGKPRFLAGLETLGITIRGKGPSKQFLRTAVGNA